MNELKKYTLDILSPAYLDILCQNETPDNQRVKFQMSNKSPSKNTTYIFNNQGVTVNCTKKRLDISKKAKQNIMKHLKSLKEELKNRREAAGISVIQLSRMLGVHRSRVYRLENGEISKPDEILSVIRFIDEYQADLLSDKIPALYLARLTGYKILSNLDFILSDMVGDNVKEDHRKQLLANLSKLNELINSK